MDAQTSHSFGFCHPHRSPHFGGGFRDNNDSAQQMQPHCLAGHPSNSSYTLELPDGWSGRVWGRHGCSFNSAGRGSCATGDCGGSMLCNGLGGTPPATLAEITLGKEHDFYDVSLVDGCNLAISLTPHRGSGKCSYAGCISDLNTRCPMGLQMRSRNKKRVVACKSACYAFKLA